MESVWSWLGKSSTLGKFCAAKCQSTSAEQNGRQWQFQRFYCGCQSQTHGRKTPVTPRRCLDDDDNCDNERKLFFCPEDGCVKSYQRYYSLEQHLCHGRHKYTLEHETLYDKAMALYATNLEHGAGVIPDVIYDVHVSLDAGSSLPMG